MQPVTVTQQNKQQQYGVIGGTQPCGRLLATSSYAHQVKPHLSPHTVGVRTRVLAEPFLSPQRHTGWIGQD